jgi:hypothetical protein
MSLYNPDQAARDVWAGKTADAFRVRYLLCDTVISFSAHASFVAVAVLRCTNYGAIPLVVTTSVSSHLLRVCDRAKSKHWSNVFDHKSLYYCIDVERSAGAIRTA